MTSRRASWTALILAVGLIAGCSGGSSEEEGPGGAVQQFYRHLNDGDYAAAKAMYSAEVLAVLDDPEVSSEEGFRSWARTETKEGSVSAVDILGEEAAEEEVRIEYRVDYRDGTSKTGSVTVTQRDGVWKLGFLG